MNIEKLATWLNGLSATVAPYLVGLWLACALVGTVYAYTLLRRARRDHARLAGRGPVLEYSAESTAGRVWIRTKTFVEFFVVGLCAVLLEVPNGGSVLALAKAVARLAYLLLLISIIIELAYNARRDSIRDSRLRVMLEARRGEIDKLHEIRQKLADVSEGLGASTEADAVHTDAGDAG